MDSVQTFIIQTRKEKHFVTNTFKG